jgi:hypothetical protein
MLTAKQKDLFKLLELTDKDEKHVRALFKTCKDGDLTPKWFSFTDYLQRGLTAKWQREHERSRPVYVGD